MTRPPISPEERIEIALRLLNEHIRLVGPFNAHPLVIKAWDALTVQPGDEKPRPS
jgi:hypothetical protein